MIITYSYYPLNNPRAYRWSALTDYLTKYNNYHADIIAAGGQGLLEHETAENLSIYRTGKNPLQVISKAATTPYSRDNKRTFFKRLLVCSKEVYRKAYWPDFAFIWYFSALKKAKELIRKHHYDCIITVSHPFTSHLLGLALKKSNPELKWLVDIGDPFYFSDTPLNNTRLYKGLNYRFEDKVLELADQISVTTQATLDKYICCFPGTASKIHVIPPLITFKNSLDESGKFFFGEGKIRLVFVGTLYKRIRNPEFLLKLFQHLVGNYQFPAKIELHFIGHCNDCMDEFLKFNDQINEHIYVHGLVEQSKALEAMRQADILVNIGNTTKYQLPSKVVEYAFLCKPILNIVTSADDSSLKFYKEYSAIFNISSAEWPTENTITELYEFICRPPEANRREVSGWLSAFSVESIAASYLKLIK